MIEKKKTEPVQPNHVLEERAMYHALLVQAITDCKAYINQCDREGIGMQTVTDHRKRVEKFLARCAAISMEKL